MRHTKQLKFQCDTEVMSKNRSSLELHTSCESTVNVPASIAAMTPGLLKTLAQQSERVQLTKYTEKNNQ